MSVSILNRTGGKRCGPLQAVARKLGDVSHEKLGDVSHENGSFSRIASAGTRKRALQQVLRESGLPSPLFFKLPVFLKLIGMDAFAAWFVVIGDATPDGIRVVRSVLGAISTPKAHYCTS